MTIDEIRELIRVVQETGIRELEVRQGENSVKIVGAVPKGQEMVVPTVLPVPIGSVVAPPPVTAAPPQESPPNPQPAAPREDEHDVLVKSPIVGTYYDAPAPASPAFVKIGDHVEPKQVLMHYRIHETNE